MEPFLNEKILINPEYRASNIEVTVEDLAKNWRDIIVALTGGLYALGAINKPKYELRFRNITLPKELDERIRRIQQITATGTDRTTRGVGNVAYDIFAEPDAIDPLLLLYTIEDEEAIRQVSDINTQRFLMKKFDMNAILIYDAQSEYGIEGYKHPRSCMSRFKKQERMNEALLGIIYVT